MKIALVGAPDSGKSELAQALALELNGEVAIVDDYVPRLEDRTDCKFGHFSDSVDNIIIFVERIVNERAADALNPQHRITCGTIIENLIYASLWATTATAIAKGDDLNEEMERSINVARIGSQFIWDTWRYDLVFVLPLPSEKRQPDAWDTILDDRLLEGLESFFIPYKALGANATVEERVAEVLLAIELEKVNQSDPESDSVPTTQAE